MTNIRGVLWSLGLSPLLGLAGLTSTPVGAQTLTEGQEPIGTRQTTSQIGASSAGSSKVNQGQPDGHQSYSTSVPTGHSNEALERPLTLEDRTEQSVIEEEEAEKVPTTIETLEQAASLRAADLQSPNRIGGDNNLSVAELFSDLEDDTFGQVTDVNQLSDVLPTDWAFQALQALITRWGCIAGYPDGTFKGQQSATRFELAAALNACLDSAADKFATKEELEIVKRLQEEFAAELAILKGRVDQLEARTDLLEDQQFSTTTKLSVNAVMAGQFGDSDGNFDPSSDGPGGPFLGDSNATAISAVYMSFNTSFTGSDLLETTLFFGNGGADFFTDAGIGGTPSLPFADSTPLFNPGQFYFSGVGQNALLYRLAYTFKPFGENFSLTAAPLFYPTDIIDGNSYTSPFTGFSSWFFINNPLITPYITNFLGGAGGGFDWNVNGGPFSVRGAYVAVNAGFATDDLNNDGGLFDDPYQGTVELEYADDFGGGKNSYAVRLQYTNSATSNIKQNVGGINFELNIGRFGLFGRYGFSDANAVGTSLTTGLPTNPVPFLETIVAGAAGKFQAQTFQAGLGVKDLLVPGSLLAAAVGQPFINNLPSAPGVNDETQTNIEAFYRFPVNDYITISPIFTTIINANNSSREPTIYQGILRVVFSF